MKDINLQIEAWNNIVSCLKFMKLEKYVTNATIEDLIDSINTLKPEYVEPDVEVDKQNDCQKEKAGFINSNDEMINHLSNCIMTTIKDELESNSTYDTILLKIKQTLKNNMSLVG